MLAAVLLLGAVSAAGRRRYPDDSDRGVNIRSGPSTSSTIIGGLYRPDDHRHQLGRWLDEDPLPGRCGVHREPLPEQGHYLAAMEVSAGIVKITTTALNLREGPGLSYDVITVIKEGVAVTMTGKTARGFAEVFHGKIRGWASLQYLASASDVLPRDRHSRRHRSVEYLGEVVGHDSHRGAEGTKLSITGATQNGRAQIIYRSRIRWVTAKYLSNPTATGPTTPSLPEITGYRYATVALNIRPRTQTLPVDR